MEYITCLLPLCLLIWILFLVFQVCFVKWASDKDWMGVNTEHCDFSRSGYWWLVKKVDLFHVLELSKLTVVTPAAFRLNTWYNGHNLTLLAVHWIVDLVLVRCLWNSELSCPCSIIASSIFFCLLRVGLYRYKFGRLLCLRDNKCF